MKGSELNTMQLVNLEFSCPKICIHFRRSLIVNSLESRE